MLRKVYDYIMNIVDRKRMKNGNLETKFDGAKSKLKREVDSKK